MNLKTLLHSLLRRWYVVLGGLIVAVALCGMAYATISPTYARTASVLLIPGATSIPAGGNPYLYLGGLGQASDVLVRALSADAVLTPIVGDDPDVKVMIARDTSTSGPIISVTASGTDDAAVAAVFADVLAVVPSTLDSLQAAAGVADDAKVTTLPLTVDAESSVSQKSRIQTMGMLGIGTVAFTLLLAGLIDGLVLARRTKRSQRSRRSQGQKRSPEVVVAAFPGYDDEEFALARIAQREKMGSIVTRPVSVAQKPATVAQNSGTVAQKPATVAQNSATVARKPAGVTEKPASVAVPTSTRG